MIAIVDYGAGNISSVKKALEHLGAETQVTSDPSVIAAAEKIVMPGVGHFSRCQWLNEQLRAPVLDAIKSGKPFLGICVGMQWLFSGSTEAPETPGAALFGWRVFSLPCFSKIAARRLEPIGSSSRIAPAPGREQRRICLLHPLISRAGDCRDDGLHKLWRRFFCRRGTRQCFWRAVSSGEIRGSGLENPGEFLCPLSRSIPAS